MSGSSGNIERVFRETLNREPKQKSGWDVPSESVWTAIEARISPDNRRRRFFWWWFAGVGMVLTALLLLLLGRTGSEPQSRAALPDAHAVATRSTASEGDLVSGSADPAIAEVMSDPSVDQLHALGVPEMETEKGMLTRNPGWGVGGSEAEKSVGSHSDGQNIRYEGEHTDAGHGLPPDDLQLPDLNQDQGASDHGTGDIPEEGERKDFHLLYHGSDITRKDVLPFPMLTSDIPGVQVERQFRSAPVPLQVIEPAASAIAPSGWWTISAFAAPAWGSRHIVVPNRQPDVLRQALRDQEMPQIQLGYGAGITRRFDRHWSLTGGVEYNQFLMESMMRRQVRFSRAGERLNARGNLESTLLMDVNTSYGDASAQVVIERSSGTQIEEHRLIGLQLSTAQELKVVEVPVSMGYHLPAGRWDLYLRAGLSVNFTLSNTMEVRSIRSTDQVIDRVRATGVVEIRDTRAIASGYQVGAGAAYALGKHWAINLEPMYSGHLQSLYRTEQIAVYPRMFEIHLGLTYHLK